jgi:putative DNA primase/helicase
MARRQQHAKPSSGVMAAGWLDQSGEIVRHFRGDFYRWELGRYRLVEKNWVENAVSRWLTDSLGLESLTARYVGEIVDVVAQMQFLDGTKAPTFWTDGQHGSNNVLVVRNGMVDLDAGALRPHDPALFAIAGADYDFDPHATCPRWLEFIQWFTSGDEGAVDLIGEFLAWVLLPSLQLQKFLWLAGDGDNGKSVFCNVLARLIGESNCCRIPLERFSSRFALSALVGKRLNIVADCEETDKVSEGILKQMTAGDPIALERKFRDMFAAPLTTRFIFSANSVARFRDRSNGIWRRLIVLPCAAVVTDQQRVVGFEDVLAAELPGILNWVLGFSRSLVERRAFTIPEVCRRATAHYRADANPARAFCDEQLEATGVPSDSIESDKIYERYRGWLEHNGYTGPLAAPNFFKELVRVFALKIKRFRYPAVGRPWGYRGLRFNPDPAGELAGGAGLPREEVQRPTRTPEQQQLDGIMT